MEFIELLRISFQSLRSNLMRTSLTMLGIIIGISSVILIVSIGQGAVQYITEQLSAFGTNYYSIQSGTDAASSFSGTQTLTLKDVEAIKKDASLTNVDKVAPLTTTTVKVTANNEEERLTIQGITTEMFEIINQELIYGEFLSEEHMIGSPRVAVIGIDAAETFFGEDTDPVGETIKIDNKNFKIIGVSKSTSAFAQQIFNNTLYIPIQVMVNSIKGKDGLQEIEVAVKNPDFMNETIEKTEELLRQEHDLKEGDENDFRVQSFTDALTTIQTVTGLLTSMIALISAISLVVGGVGVMNIMLVTVTERTKEIGLLKSIGAKRKDILVQFLLESIVITLTGGIIGIILGIAGAFVVTKIANIPFIISIPSILIATGVSIFVGVVFGLYPARRAASLSPIDALRYE